MSVADHDRLVFEEYADLGRHLSGVWRRERLRRWACRWGWRLVVGFARAGLAMIGVNPNEVRSVESGPAGGQRSLKSGPAGGQRSLGSGPAGGRRTG